MNFSTVGHIVSKSLLFHNDVTSTSIFGLVLIISWNVHLENIILEWNP